MKRFAMLCLAVCLLAQPGYAENVEAWNLALQGEGMERFEFEGEVSDAILLEEGSVSVYAEPKEGTEEIGEISAPKIIRTGEVYSVPSDAAPPENPWGEIAFSHVWWWDAQSNAIRSGYTLDSERSGCRITLSTEWNYAVTGYIGEVMGEEIQLRGGPRSDAVPAAPLKKGSHLYVLGSADGDWLYASTYPFRRTLCAMQGVLRGIIPLSRGFRGQRPLIPNIQRGAAACSAPLAPNQSASCMVLAMPAPVKP